jgi:hypothetical protein
MVKIAKPDMLHYFDETKPAPIDDVYLGRIFRWNVHKFEEAILNHREFFHPTIYDYIDPYVQLFIEFNMTVCFHLGQLKFYFNIYKIF